MRPNLKETPPPLPHPRQHLHHLTFHFTKLCQPTAAKLKAFYGHLAEAAATQADQVESCAACFFTQRHSVCECQLLAAVLPSQVCARAVPPNIVCVKVGFVPRNRMTFESFLRVHGLCHWDSKPGDAAGCLLTAREIHCWP